MMSCTVFVSSVALVVTVHFPAGLTDAGVVPRREAEAGGVGRAELIVETAVVNVWGGEDRRGWSRGRRGRQE